jgi:hypothetical protein
MSVVYTLFHLWLISYDIETMILIPACSFLLVLHYLYTFGAVLMWSIRAILVDIRFNGQVLIQKEEIDLVYCTIHEEKEVRVQFPLISHLEWSISFNC